MSRILGVTRGPSNAEMTGTFGALKQDPSAAALVFYLTCSKPRLSGGRGCCGSFACIGGRMVSGGFNLDFLGPEDQDPLLLVRTLKHENAQGVDHRLIAKMIGLLHLVKEFMVGIFSKGVYLANTYVFKQLKNLGQQLLDTLRRHDVVVEVDSSNDGATGDSLISQSNEENGVDLQLIFWNDAGKKHVGSEIFDKKLAKRDQQIELEEYLMIYSKKVVDEVKSIGDWLYWPASVEGEASKGWFLQMADSLDKKDKVFNQIMHIKFVPT
ncbi:hypothetical protein Tco_1183554 [Tanacetum coccineum]